MNKKTIQKLLAVLMIPVLYYFVVSGFSTDAGHESNLITNRVKVPPAPSGGKDFINCIFNGAPESTPSNKWVEDNLSKYLGELKFNAIHIYDNINWYHDYHFQNGTDTYGKFGEDLSQEQIDNTHGLMDNIDNAGLKLVYERCNLSKLCYAQRLVYEVSDGGSTTENYGFCYHYTSGCYETDQGRTVLHLSPNTIQNCNEQDATPRDIAWNVYENMQHGDLTDFNVQLADLGTWYVKPMMRIDSNIVDQHPDWNVVRIDIHNFRNLDDQPVKSVMIKADNFNDENGNYGGQYIDVFHFSGGTNLEISGDTTWGSGGLNEGVNRINMWQWPNYCHVDFRVHWMGDVEVWFDKMTVDDEIANRLFNPVPGANYDSNIVKEVTNFGTYAPLYTFFADECVHSNIPCVKYVVDKIRSMPQDVKICFATTNGLNARCMRNDSYGFGPILDAVKPDYFSVDAHELWGYDNSGNCIPEDVFPDLSTMVPGWWQVSYTTYTNWLQNQVLGDKTTSTGNGTRSQGSYVYQVALARSQADQYSPGAKFMMQPQIHAYVSDIDDDGVLDYGLREPTDEEIQAEAMIAIAHGADGLFWFWYPSYKWTYRPRRVSSKKDSAHHSSM